VQKPLGAFVFTSNVDGHFQRAGFDPAFVAECHGSIHHLQCVRPCCDAIWSAAETIVTVDQETFRAIGPLPACPHCDGLARPNILMFGDTNWIPDRSDRQEAEKNRWLAAVRSKRARLVIVEFGAGAAIPTVRMLSEAASEDLGAVLIRVNPRESQVPAGQISLALGAAEAIKRIGSL
jgi:NAD-dependent SIR2 family protein deacetylase